MSAHAPYKLSYMIDTAGWDGKFVRRFPEETYLPELEDMRRAGLSEVMLSGYVTVEQADFDVDEETKRLGASLDSKGFRPAQHHGLSAVYALPDRSQEPVVEKLIQSVRWTANLNAPALVLHPCHYLDSKAWAKSVSVQDYFADACARFGKDTIVKTAAANLHEAGKEAERLGVKIAMENLDRFEPMGDRDTLTELVRLADSPAVGFCLDAGHAHCCGVTTPAQWVEIMGEKLFTTHFHDNRGARFAPRDGYVNPTEAVDEHLPVGFGTIPWVDVIRALWKIGYTGTVNNETHGWKTAKGYDYEMPVAYWRRQEAYAEELR